MFIKNKRKARYIGALTIATVLSFMGCRKEEIKVEKTAEENIEEVISQEKEKTFLLSSCQVIVENFPDGSVKHHFITTEDWEMYDIVRIEKETYTESKYEYKAITDENLVFSDLIIRYNESYQKYEKIPETDGKYIFDYNIPYFKMDVRNIKLPEGYVLFYHYNVKEFRELEEKLDASLYNQKEKDEYYTNALLLIKIFDEYMCIDCSGLSGSKEWICESTDPYDEKKLEKFIYLPIVGNNTFNLKVREAKGEDAVFNVFEKSYAYETTSLDQTIRNDLRGSISKIQLLSNYLSYEQW